MQLKDFTYLRIEHYSGHPEVKAAADILVDHIASGKSFLKDKPGWTKAARKLVASLWMREGYMFRFGTKKDYFSAGSRKQVWLTPRTLQLFKAMLDLGWVSKAYDAIPPEYAKKHLQLQSALANQVDRRWLNGFMAAGFHSGLISLSELKLEYMKAHRNAYGERMTEAQSSWAFAKAKKFAIRCEWTTCL